MSRRAHLGPSVPVPAAGGPLGTFEARAQRRALNPPAPGYSCVPVVPVLATTA
jgi:hypothetical protein